MRISALLLIIPVSLSATTWSFTCPTNDEIKKSLLDQEYRLEKDTTPFYIDFPMKKTFQENQNVKFYQVEQKRRKGEIECRYKLEDLIITATYFFKGTGYTDDTSTSECYLEGKQGPNFSEVAESSDPGSINIICLPR